ncbi:MAG: hypothetical protein DMF62_13340 [Acidobacteria bacterium]|nr:MAG: hypothetical protein DMF62_13340 [Acidobacteriota bacterium]
MSNSNKASGDGNSVENKRDLVENEDVIIDNDDPIDSTSNEITATPKNGNRKRRLFLFGGIGLAVVLIGGLIYWLYARQFESTDDAFVDGDIVQVSPRVSAIVTKVHVVSNQFVHRGEPLIDLDTGNLEVKLEQAKAQLQTAQSQYDQAVANAKLTKKSTMASQTQALSNVETTKTNVEQTRIAAQSKHTQISQAQAALRTAQANLAQSKAQVAQPEADVRLAEVEHQRRLNAKCPFACRLGAKAGGFGAVACRRGACERKHRDRELSTIARPGRRDPFTGWRIKGKA